MPLCDKYRGVENAYGYCVYRYVGGLRTRAEMEAACSLAEAWEPECRHAWVAGRMQLGTGFTTEDLLEACGPNPDCTFELIDFRPAEDPIEQMKLCAAHAGTYARDCAGHAMQRWWLTDPSAEAWGYVAQYTTPFADRVGYWLGVEVGCFDKGSCAGVGFVQQQCELTSAQFREKPTSCPLREKTPLNMPTPSSSQEPGRPPPPGTQGRPVGTHGPANGARPPGTPPTAPRPGG